MRRALALLLGVALAAGPTTTTIVVAASGMGMPCCEEMAAAAHCHETGATLTCCHPDQPTPPAAPASAAANAPVVPAGDSGALLRPADAPLVALVASRSFAAWPGHITGPPTHIVLNNFRI